MYNLKIELDRLPVSYNLYLRTHYLKRHRQNKFWQFFIEYHVKNKKPAQPLTKAHISIIRYSHRMLDYDGLVGSLKPVVDALVVSGVISDDSWGVLGAWDCSQVFRAKKLGPLLTIEITEP